jgi:ATP-dependent Clp protease adaptor protein ClpS
MIRGIPMIAMATKTVTAPKVDTENATRHAPRYNLILLDDDDHSYEYVIEMLVAVFAHTEQQAFQFALEVDSSGRAIVFTGHLELVELKQDQVHSFGADWRIPGCKGAMTAVIEKFSD